MIDPGHLNVRSRCHGLYYEQTLSWHQLTTPRGVTFIANWTPLSLTIASSWFNVGPGPPDRMPLELNDTFAVAADVHAADGPTFRSTTCGSRMLMEVNTCAPVAAFVVVVSTAPLVMLMATVTGAFRLKAAMRARSSWFCTSVTACLNSERDCHTK